MNVSDAPIRQLLAAYDEPLSADATVKRRSLSNDILRQWLAAYEERMPDGTARRRTMSDEALRRWMAAYDEALGREAIADRRNVPGTTLQAWVVAYDETMEPGVIVTRDDFTKQCTKGTGCGRGAARTAYHDYLPKSRKNDRRGAGVFLAVPCKRLAD
jgi:hypothetical protein